MGCIGRVIIEYSYPEALPGGKCSDLVTTPDYSNYKSKVVISYSIKGKGAKSAKNQKQ